MRRIDLIDAVACVQMAFEDCFSDIILFQTFKAERPTFEVVPFQIVGLYLSGPAPLGEGWAGGKGSLEFIL